MTISKLIKGADLKCYINASLVGEVMDLSYNIDYGKKEIGGVDSLLPFEITPGPARISGKITLYRMRGLGGLEGRGLVGDFSNLSKEKYITIQIIDRVIDSEIMKISRATVNNQSWNVGAKSIMTGTFSFSGILYSNDFSG